MLLLELEKGRMEMKYNPYLLYTFIVPIMVPFFFSSWCVCVHLSCFYLLNLFRTLFLEVGFWFTTLHLHLLLVSVQ